MQDKHVKQLYFIVIEDIKQDVNKKIKLVKSIHNVKRLPILLTELVTYDELLVQDG